MLSKSALVVAASVAVVEAIDNGLARTPQMGWVSFSLRLWSVKYWLRNN